MIKRLQEVGNIKTQNSTHDLSDAKEDGHAINRKSSVLEQGIEGDTEAFATACYAESVECDDEKCWCITLETAGHDREHREYETADNLKRRGNRDVSKEESLNAINAVVVIAVEDVSLDRIHSDVVEHY